MGIHRLFHGHHIIAYEKLQIASLAPSKILWVPATDQKHGICDPMGACTNLVSDKATAEGQILMRDPIDCNNPSLAPMSATSLIGE